jgi:hypothetical protein
MSVGTSLGGLLLRSAVLVVISALVAVGVNAGRPDSLEWVASAEYEIYEECPEGTGSATAVTLGEILENPDYFFLVDCRRSEEYEQSHIPDALSIPYDPLFSVDEEVILEIQKESDGRTVVVVGDTLTAKLLADDLVTQGMEYVQYLDDGEDWRSLLASEED